MQREKPALLLFLISRALFQVYHEHLGPRCPKALSRWVVPLKEQPWREEAESRAGAARICVGPTEVRQPRQECKKLAVVPLEQCTPGVNKQCLPGKGYGTVSLGKVSKNTYYLESLAPSYSNTYQKHLCQQGSRGKAGNYTSEAPRILKKGING